MKRYEFKIFDEKEIAYADSVENISEHIRNLLNQQRQGNLVFFDAPQLQKLLAQIENLKIGTLNETLDAWKKIKELGGDISKLDSFIKGRQELPSPVKTDLQPKDEKTIGLDGNNFCDFCKHKHADTEPKVCTDLYCYCGVRG
jgi:hypothetical protein